MSFAPGGVTSRHQLTAPESSSSTQTPSVPSEAIWNGCAAAGPAASATASNAAAMVGFCLTIVTPIAALRSAAGRIMPESPARRESGPERTRALVNRRPGPTRAGGRPVVRP